MLIAFIGPDGCGKTTVATRIRDQLKESGQDILFFELNYGILPRFRDMASFVFRRKVGKTHVPGEYLAGMEQLPNAPLKGAIYMLWYGLDYFVGRFKYRASADEQSVIFARYVYDYAFQRSYARVPRPVFRLMLLMARKPDLVFTIDRSSEEIFAGKPELTVAEIQRQQASIRALLAGKTYFHELDGNQGVDVTVATALGLIQEKAQV